MTSIKAIGGFFELETSGRGEEYHRSAIGMANGRTCFRAILKRTAPARVYIPYYCCDTLFEPLIREKIDFVFYAVSPALEPEELPDLKKDELFLFVNYFGLKTDFACALTHRYGDRLVIDDTQNYFRKGYSRGWSFNSARKFFGVPDGGYLYPPCQMDIPEDRNQSFITDHLVLRLDGRQPEAFAFYRQNEALQGSDLRLVSAFSESILRTIDYPLVAAKRRRNFEFYQRQLNDINSFPNLALDGDMVPFCYPFFSPAAPGQDLFYSNEIFFPMLWKDVVVRDKSDNFLFEKKFSRALLPLPVDHRYDEADLTRIINLINQPR